MTRGMLHFCNENYTFTNLISSKHCWLEMYHRYKIDKLYNLLWGVRAAERRIALFAVLPSAQHAAFSLINCCALSLKQQVLFIQHCLYFHH